LLLFVGWLFGLAPVTPGLAQSGFASFGSFCVSDLSPPATRDAPFWPRETVTGEHGSCDQTIAVRRIRVQRHRDVAEDEIHGRPLQCWSEPGWRSHAYDGVLGNLAALCRGGKRVERWTDPFDPSLRCVSVDRQAHTHSWRVWTGDRDEQGITHRLTRAW
jgi:hypothetical protein